MTKEEIQKIKESREEKRRLGEQGSEQLNAMWVSFVCWTDIFIKHELMTKEEQSSALLSLRDATKVFYDNISILKNTQLYYDISEPLNQDDYIIIR